MAPLSKTLHLQLTMSAESKIFKPIVVNNVLGLCEIALEFQRLILQACHQSQKWHSRF